MASHTVTKLTEEQYLALERLADFKSEYFDGEMFAMSGASMQHVRLQQNLATELSNALRGGRCEAFGSHFRVRVSSRMYTSTLITRWFAVSLFLPTTGKTYCSIPL